jgi:hypothetical protein
MRAPSPSAFADAIPETQASASILMEISGGHSQVTDEERTPHTGWEWHLDPFQERLSVQVWEVGKRAWEESQAHYEQSKIWSAYDLRLSIAATILATASGTAAFSELVPRWAVAVVALLAAVCAGLVAALKTNDRADKHKSLGVEFASIRGDCLDFCNWKVMTISHEEAGEAFAELRKRWEAASKDAPLTSNKARSRAAKLLEKDVAQGGLAMDIGPPIGAGYVAAPEDPPGREPQ